METKKKKKKKTHKSKTIGKKTMKSRVYILKLGLPHWAESLGKPKNTGVDGLSLLQGIFLTQEMNLGLPHFRQILYRLSYKGLKGKKVKSTVENSGQ